MVPQRFFVHQQAARGDRHVYAGRTRFIPGTILGLFASETWPVAAAATMAKPAPRPRIDLAAEMRSMWR